MMTPCPTCGRDHSDAISCHDAEDAQARPPAAPPSPVPPQAPPSAASEHVRVLREMRDQEETWKRLARTNGDNPDAAIPRIAAIDAALDLLEAPARPPAAPPAEPEGAISELDNPELYRFKIALGQDVLGMSTAQRTWRRDIITKVKQLQREADAFRQLSNLAESLRGSLAALAAPVRPAEEEK